MLRKKLTRLSSATLAIIFAANVMFSSTVLASSIEPAEKPIETSVEEEKKEEVTGQKEEKKEEQKQPDIAVENPFNEDKRDENTEKKDEVASNSEENKSVEPQVSDEKTEKKENLPEEDSKEEKKTDIKYEDLNEEFKALINNVLEEKEIKGDVIFSKDVVVENAEFPLTLDLDVEGVAEGDNLKVLHFTGENWEDIEIKEVRENTVIATFNSLSPVVIVKVKSDEEVENNTEESEALKATKIEKLLMEGHNLLYVSNEDGTHTVKCADEGCEIETIVENCVLNENNICEKCGTEVVKLPEYEFEEKTLEAEVSNIKVVVSGEMPVNTELSVEKKRFISSENELSEDEHIVMVLDIKLLVEGKEYEPSDYDKKVSVRFENLDELTFGTTSVYHDTEEGLEQMASESIKEGEASEISFETDSFSEYVISDYFMTMTKSDEPINLPVVSHNSSMWKFTLKPYGASEDATAFCYDAGKQASSSAPKYYYDEKVTDENVLKVLNAFETEGFDYFICQAFVWLAQTEDFNETNMDRILGAEGFNLEASERTSIIEAVKNASSNVDWYFYKNSNNDSNYQRLISKLTKIENEKYEAESGKVYVKVVQDTVAVDYQPYLMNIKTGETLAGAKIESAPGLYSFDLTTYQKYSLTDNGGQTLIKFTVDGNDFIFGHDVKTTDGVYEGGFLCYAPLGAPSSSSFDMDSSIMSAQTVKLPVSNFYKDMDGLESNATTGTGFVASFTTFEGINLETKETIFKKVLPSNTSVFFDNSEASFTHCTTHGDYYYKAPFIIPTTGLPESVKEITKIGPASATVSGKTGNRYSVDNWYHNGNEAGKRASLEQILTGMGKSYNANYGYFTFGSPSDGGKMYVKLFNNGALSNAGSLYFVLMLTDGETAPSGGIESSGRYYYKLQKEGLGLYSFTYDDCQRIFGSMFADPVIDIIGGAGYGNNTNSVNVIKQKDNNISGMPQPLADSVLSCADLKTQFTVGTEDVEFLTKNKNGVSTMLNDENSYWGNNCIILDYRTIFRGNKADLKDASKLSKLFSEYWTRGYMKYGFSTSLYYALNPTIVDGAIKDAYKGPTSGKMSDELAGTAMSTEYDISSSASQYSKVYIDGNELSYDDTQAFRSELDTLASLNSAFSEYANPYVAYWLYTDVSTPETSKYKVKLPDGTEAEVEPGGTYPFHVPTGEIWIEKDSSPVKEYEPGDHTLQLPITPPTPEKPAIELEKYFKVTFDVNGGTPALSSVKVKANNTVAAPSQTIEKPGYTFKGWNKDNTAYDFDTPVTGSFTLTADWTPFVNVTFDTKGGTPIPSTQSFASGGKATEPSTAPSLDGSVFKYWTFNGMEYNFNNVVNSDITLEAYYEGIVPPVTHKLTFIDEVTGQKIDEYNSLDDSTITPPPAPAHDGYTFTGWNPSVPTKAMADGTYVAKYSQNNYTVTFVDYDDREISKKTDYHYNDNLVKPANPTRTGYTFTGWAPNVPTKVTDNGTYKATYSVTPVKKYTVVFKDYNNIVISSNMYSNGDTIGIPANPTRTGYTFKGWTPTVKNICDGSATYRAQYTKNADPVIPTKKYVVKFNDYDGSNISSQTLALGDVVSIPSEPSRSGYTFKGWTPSVNGTCNGSVVYKATYTRNSSTESARPTPVEPIKPNEPEKEPEKEAEEEPIVPNKEEPKKQAPTEPEKEPEKPAPSSNEKPSQLPQKTPKKQEIPKEKEVIKQPTEKKEAGVEPSNNEKPKKKTLFQKIKDLPIAIKTILGGIVTVGLGFGFVALGKFTSLGLLLANILFVKKRKKWHGILTDEDNKFIKYTFPIKQDDEDAGTRYAVSEIISKHTEKGQLAVDDFIEDITSCGSTTLLPVGTQMLITYGVGEDIVQETFDDADEQKFFDILLSNMDKHTKVTLNLVSARHSVDIEIEYQL